MKKDLFKTHLLLFAVFCGLALASASCANEDVAQRTTDTETENDNNLTAFVAGDGPTTRTSMDYNTGNFYWEAGDKIYVKDDDNIWRKSTNAPTGKTASFKFKVPGKFNNSTTYKVYYPGKNGNNDQVTIPASQTQTTPNSTEHFGVSGDCGTATATKVTGKNQFEFKLDHQAAYLVFQPYTSNTILKDCYLTKIEVTSDNDITHTYTLNPTTGELTGTGSGKKIILTTKSTGSYTNGFPLTNTSANVTTNGAYMVIKPGTHKLKVRYWVKDVATQVEGTITKILGSFNYDKNTYYDMTADLNVRDYDGDHYYMWDAQKQYWYGYEWNQSGDQPSLSYANGGTTSNNYPKSNSDPRYYNENYFGWNIRNDAQTVHFQTIPNVNELGWYVKKGDARWDGDELWTAMGHLYKGGIWLLKHSKITGYSKEYAPNGSDLRVSAPIGYDYTPSATLPSAADAENYFYLPALGIYSVTGSLSYFESCGINGYYWSSSASSWYSSWAYSLHFSSGNVQLQDMTRAHGMRVQPFSDFGDS